MAGQIIGGMGTGSGSGSVDGPGNLGKMGIPPGVQNLPGGQMPYPPQIPAQSPGQVSDVLPGQYRWPGTIPKAGK